MHPRAGTPATADDLTDIDALLRAYTDRHPDPSDPDQRVVFGTSGHRGSSLTGAFTEDHILATTQAIVDHRREQGITGPLFIGRDTHALSEPAHMTALEVLAGNGVEVYVDSRGSWTPTPAVSFAILEYNRRLPGGPTGTDAGRADGIVVTPSHNPPRDGGFKYNPPTGGPAGSDATSRIADRANAYLERGLEGVRRAPVPEAVALGRASGAGADGDGSGAGIRPHDYLGTYVDALPQVVDLDAVRSAGVRIGADPMGGASVDYWGRIGEVHGLDLTVVNPQVDPAFGFMTLDADGEIRMDCSSRWSMASLVENRGSFDIATGNDADSDRHGVVTPDGGLMNPNHYLSVCVDYLFRHRPDWPVDAAVGKTVVSSSMIDRVAEAAGRRLTEVPVGFKWFVPGLVDGSVGFGGEESAGASFLRRDGSVWTTDKDGIIADLLASEILAVTGESPSAAYARLEERHGRAFLDRVDAPADRERRDRLRALSAADTGLTAGSDELAGETVTGVLTEAPGTGAAIGGVKVTTENAWFAARPSGTEDKYKIYAESFRSEGHLRQVLEQAQGIVDGVLGG
ncbi:phosphoglucomutase (alpha-D-glucose-1,6-bisphosphate-dependent) [Corynebacterium bovis]|uniref:phosphoglucomutase (alpha-D-glucose-1,6-bisphosphate-dependent) n=1 Tax=Corynebacterium bovis TaxID=36808 RepID=UPI0031397B4C